MKRHVNIPVVVVAALVAGAASAQPVGGPGPGGGTRPVSYSQVAQTPSSGVYI